jgi:CoA:oxalate CoA-transferase
MTGPLAGIRVLDFTWALAGPYGSMILTDMGAEVIKIEPVGIDEHTRGPGPYVDGVSTYFFSINRGKQSLTLDLKSQRGREIVYDLIGQVDVLTENFTPGTMDRLGLGYEELAKRNPPLIYASTSGFGQTGPYRDRGAVDVIIQGMGGLMSITGHPDGPVTRAGYSIADMAGGMYTALGVLGSLVERSTSGLGQRVDVAMLDAQVALLENAVVRHMATGEVPGPIGTRHPLVTPFQAFATLDGHLVIAGVKDWELFCAKIDRDDLITDDRFQTNADRTQNHGQLEPLLIEVFATRTTNAWIDELSAICLIGPVNTIPDLVQDPQIVSREMVVELPHPLHPAASLSVSNSPVKLSRTPVHAQGAAPRAGQHSLAILRQMLDLSEAEVHALVDDGVTSLDSAASDV